MYFEVFSLLKYFFILKKVSIFVVTQYAPYAPIQPDKDKKKVAGSATVSSRTFMIRLEDQKTIVDEQPVEWDYKPSCASFLKCKFADGKGYDYWSESYVRKSHARLSLLVEREERIGIRDDVRKSWLLKKR